MVTKEMATLELKKKLFEKVKEHNLILFHAVPNNPFEYSRYFFEGDKIEEFIEFANKVGTKIIYYDLDYFEEEGSEKKLVGLAVHFNHEDKLYRFNWREDWYHNKLKEDAEKKEAKTDEHNLKTKEEMDKITVLREQYEQLFNGRFDDIDKHLKDMENHFLELVNALNEVVHGDKEKVEKS
jgi:hypothetical protein